MKRCEILVTEEDGQERAGVIILDNGKVKARAETGYENLMQGILREPSYVNGVQTKAKDSAQAWFDSLPEQYSGWKVRARML